MENTDQLMRNRAKAIRLIGIANELLAMARELEIGESPSAILDSLAGGTAEGGKVTASQDHPIWVELARQNYDDRRRRTKIFRSEELFGEPAWDILLDLFISEHEQRRLSVSAVCIGARAPSATALRYLAMLQDADLVERIRDACDGRRSHVQLTALELSHSRRPPTRESRAARRRRRVPCAGARHSHAGACAQHPRRPPPRTPRSAAQPL